MTKFRKLLSLSAYQWTILISSIILLPMLSLSIKLIGFKRNYNKALYTHDIDTLQTHLSPEQLQQAKNIARVINIAATHGLFKANCLSRSLLLMRVLKKHQIPCHLMIGANTEEDISKIGLNAHAWVESNSIVLNDQSDIAFRFKAFPLSHGSLK